jgi:lipopolysaccharide transport system permease protein
MEQAVYSDKPRSIWSYLDPVEMVRNLYSHRHLTWQFAKRQIEARYKAQRLGLLWAVLTPLFMLAVYTFVFAVVFPTKLARDPSEIQREPLGQFALWLFIGLLVFGLFRDMVVRAPGVVISYPNYVKRIVFPLEVMAVAELICALVTFCIGWVVWLIGWGIIEQRLPGVGLLLMPVLVVPVCLFALGLSWIFSSLGVFLRDLTNIVELGATVLFFLTPIFYAIKHVPAEFQPLLAANPLAAVIEDVRNVVMNGAMPNFAWFGWALGISLLTAIVGYAFFMKSKRAFADVV